LGLSRPVARDIYRYQIETYVAATCFDVILCAKGDSYPLNGNLYTLHRFKFREVSKVNQMFVYEEKSTTEQHTGF
jgi:hypothetical protein